MLDVSITRHSKNAAHAVRRAQKDRLERGADVGFNTALDHTPSGATNTLRTQMFEPTWRGDTLVWGNSADHAPFVEEGTDPHWIPLEAMDGLKRWARRVLGDESAAWAVRQSIAENGTRAQRFMREGAERQREYYRANDLERFLERQLD